MKKNKKKNRICMLLSDSSWKHLRLSYRFKCIFTSEKCEMMHCIFLFVLCKAYQFSQRKEFYIKNNKFLIHKCIFNCLQMKSFDYIEIMSFFFSVSILKSRRQLNINIELFILLLDTYVWYCCWRKLNSSFIRSSVSAIVNLIGPCAGGP